MSIATIRTAAAAFVAARDAVRAHVDAYETACAHIPCPRKATSADIAAYSAARVEATARLGLTAAQGAALHRAMLAARADLLRVSGPVMRRPELRALRDADPQTQAETIARAAGITA